MLFLEKMYRTADAKEAAHILRKYKRDDFAEVMCMIIKHWAAGRRENPVKVAEKIAETMHRLYGR